MMARQFPTAVRPMTPQTVSDYSDADGCSGRRRRPSSPGGGASRRQRRLPTMEAR